MTKRDNILAIFDAAIRKVNPRNMIKASLDSASIDFSQYKRIFVSGMGKASARMAQGIEDYFPNQITGGLVAVKTSYTEKLNTIKLIEASHPLPDKSCVDAAVKILNLAQTVSALYPEKALAPIFSEDDLVIVLVSGGGSSLLCAPIQGISLEDKISTTNLLLSSGASIYELNCVRKHLSKIKGGRLAKAYYPARIVSLILSDVIGDDLSVIASGPTVYDTSTAKDALSVLEKYCLCDKVPKNVISVLEEATKKEKIEFSKSEIIQKSKCRVTNILSGTNKLAIESAKAEAIKKHYNTMVLSTSLTADADEIGKVFFSIAREILSYNSPISTPACIITGGESTVKIKGSGKGGRNQQMAISFLSELSKLNKQEQKNFDFDKICFASIGTDGSDGPTDAAGAFADTLVCKLATEQNLSISKYLDNNDAYNFFDKTAGLIKTGPTNTNVCDIQILLIN